MDKVRVSVRELLQTVTENREKHKTVYEEAMEGYRDEAVKQLQEMLEEAQSGGKIRRALNLVEPMNNLKEYDRVLAMLGMTVDDTVELDEFKFAQYVLDEWTWKDAFTHSNVRYLKS